VSLQAESLPTPSESAGALECTGRTQPHPWRLDSLRLDSFGHRAVDRVSALRSAASPHLTSPCAMHRDLSAASYVPVRLGEQRLRATPTLGAFPGVSLGGVPNVRIFLVVSAFERLPNHCA
jgi:hypothetical protein